MRLFVDICENLASINLFYLLENRIINSSQNNLKTFKDLKDLHSNLKTFKDFKDRYEPCLSKPQCSL
jgi:glutaredoxin-related protein